LQRTLAKKPKILVINCHGGIDFIKDTTNFWFEDVYRPTVVDSFTEERLRSMLQTPTHDNPLTEVQLVIISACHSSRLANILVAAGIPSVISISASSQVLELAAKAFNVEFLHYLIEGNSV
jgi:CHAT domain